MDEFNGKRFYGYSLQSDPALSTTTRNFEFKYTRPEQLDRAIQKVQLSDSGSDKQKKADLLNKYCKFPRASRDHHGKPIHSRDIDIETHMSRLDGSNKVRPLSENEVDNIICKVRNGDSQDSDDENAANACGNDDFGRHEDKPTGLEDFFGNMKPEGLMYCEDFDEGECDWGFAYQEAYTPPQCQWVEIVENQQGVASLMEDLSEQNTDDSDKILEVCQMPYGGGSNEHGALNVAEGEEFDESEYFNATVATKDGMFGAAGMMGFMRNGGSHLPRTTNTNIATAVDSDLEFEMLDRQQYMRFCEPRPREEDMRQSSNEGAGFAEFIEVEPMYLKNAAPMRYTDQMDEAGQDPEESGIKVVIKPVVKGKDAKVAQKWHKHPDPPAEPKHDEKKPPPKEAKKKSAAAAATNLYSPYNSKLAPKQVRPAAPESERLATPRSARTKNRAAAPSPVASPRASPRQRAGATATGVSSAASGKRKPKPEDLKVEKLALFTKMTTTQERTIELLDRLKVDLVEMYVPKSSVEKAKRQRNAFEFSVRFSRNFLYPLKGMVEELKLTTVEQLNSAASNEATGRVSTIYSLIFQSLQTYHKQLRYFLLDQVPQKLSTLIEMLYATTNMCLEKGVFDRHDAIIDCLQERCTKFLGFLEDQHEERFVTARENFRKHASDKYHSNYNLKMFMNDLNMYEPKLVPKKMPLKKKRPQSSKEKPEKTSPTVPPNRINDSETMMVNKANEDAISTQMGGNMDFETSIPTSMQNLLSSSSDATMHDLASSDSISANQDGATTSTSVEHFPGKQPKPQATRELAGSSLPINKALVDALQVVTKQQIREVLEPFMQNLGTALEQKNGRKVENVLNAFKTKATALMKQGDKKRLRAGQQPAQQHQPNIAGANIVSSYGGGRSRVASAAVATRATKAAKQTKATRVSIKSFMSEATEKRRQHQHRQQRLRVKRSDEASDQKRASDGVAAAASGGDGGGGGEEVAGGDDGDNSDAIGAAHWDAEEADGAEQLDEEEEDDDDDGEDDGEDDERRQASPAMSPSSTSSSSSSDSDEDSSRKAERAAKGGKVATTNRNGLTLRQQQQLAAHQQRIKFASKAGKGGKVGGMPPSSLSAAGRRNAGRKLSGQATASTLPRSVTSKLYRRRRNPLNSPPPAPAGSPLSSAHREPGTPQQVPSDTHLKPAERFSLPSLQKARADVTAAFEECRALLLPHLYALKKNAAADGQRPATPSGQHQKRHQRQHQSALSGGERPTEGSADAGEGDVASGCGDGDGELTMRADCSGTVFGIDDFDVPLTDVFDLSELRLNISSRRSTGNNTAAVAGASGGPEASSEDYEDPGQGERQHLINQFLVNALRDLKQSTTPLCVNMNPYERNAHQTRPSQQELHESQLRQQRMEIQREELRVQQLKMKQLFSPKVTPPPGGGNIKHPQQQLHHQQQQQAQQRQQMSQEQLIGAARSCDRNENYMQSSADAAATASTSNHSGNRSQTNNNNYNNNKTNNGIDIVIEDIPDSNDEQYDYYTNMNGSSNKSNSNNKQNMNENNDEKTGDGISTKKPHIDVEAMVAKRDRFLKACYGNRFYSNSVYPEPWKVFSQFSENITKELVTSVERDFTQGVSKFVHDFIQQETRI